MPRQMGSAFFGRFLFKIYFENGLKWPCILHGSFCTGENGRNSIPGLGIEIAESALSGERGPDLSECPRDGRFRIFFVLIFEDNISAIIGVLQDSDDPGKIDRLLLAVDPDQGL